MIDCRVEQVRVVIDYANGGSAEFEIYDLSYVDIERRDQGHLSEDEIKAVQERPFTGGPYTLSFKLHDVTGVTTKRWLPVDAGQQEY